MKVTVEIIDGPRGEVLNSTTFQEAGDYEYFTGGALAVKTKDGNVRKIRARVRIKQ